jgi:hypothetical protein
MTLNPELFWEERSRPKPAAALKEPEGPDPKKPSPELDPRPAAPSEDLDKAPQTSKDGVLVADVDGAP